MEKKTKTRALSLLAAGGIAAGAVATGVVGGDGIGGPDEAAAQALEPFSSCDELLEYARDHRWAAQPHPIPLEGDIAFSAGSAEGAPVARDGATLAAPAEAESEAVGPSETGTNVQEAGIDEPDVAKLAGTTLFVARGERLLAYDVAGEEAVLLDELELPFASGAPAVDIYQPGIGGAELLVAGDRVIAIATGWDRGGEQTEVVEVDASDPGALTAVSKLAVEGSHVSARLQGTTARLVLESRPDFFGGQAETPSKPIPEAQPPTGATGETGPEEPSGEEPGWLPQATLHDLETGEEATAPLSGCEDVSYPGEFSGLGMLSVLTIDVESGLGPADVDSVMTDGTTVYASEGSLYVATQTVMPPDDGMMGSLGRMIAPDTAVVSPTPSDTQIHRFATSEGAETAYAASGSVPGRLIGQFAMSEADGVLRVASTEGDAWAEGPGESESMITTLAESDGELTQLGRVGGLGPGEEIYAVRFIGDMGYVVTFEQTDPLYTVDLSDPESPETTGELKIPGYSAYLHPVADGRLLGIGQDGTNTGATTGAQASLFDVSDPTSPVRMDELALSEGYGSASAEWDHHAFMFSPEHGLAVVPVQSYGRNGVQGAVAMNVDPDSGLTEVAKLEDQGQIERMLIAGENLVTVSAQGVSIRTISSLG